MRIKVDDNSYCAAFTLIAGLPLKIHPFAVRYFFENLFTLQPQNLIPEAVWMSGALYFLVLLACMHSILHFLNLGIGGKFLWVTIVLIPFLGPLVYASYRLTTSESTLKEIWQSKGGNVE